MDAVQGHQSDEYAFPYHYVPSLSADGTRFSAKKSWNFSESYAVALLLAKEWIKREGLQAGPHIDIGCGDGGFLFNLSKFYPGMQAVGIDYDTRAIAWAKMFSKDIEFHCADIYSDEIASILGVDAFRSASLVEVVEHIPPDRLPGFVAAGARLLAPGAALFVTVPHLNKALEPKHYQHFDFASLAAVFDRDFELKSMQGFETHTLLKRTATKVFQNKLFFLEAPALARLSLARELRGVRADEKGCGRIVAEFRKR